MWKKMKILITGGAGYIGSHVVKELVRKHSIIVFDNLSKGYEKAVDKKATFVKGDLANFNEIDNCLRNSKVDAVAKVFKKIAIDKLYDDELYQRHVRAHAKVRLAHMLQTFNYQLPGDVTINYQNMVATAEKEMEEVKTMIKGENTTDWMFLVHQ